MTPEELRIAQEDISVHGARVGDFVRLGDTQLVIRVEGDDRQFGSELQMGFGKSARDGMGLKSVTTAES